MNSTALPLPPKIGVLIVNWNGKQDTLECLSALDRDTYENKSVLVVDNGSEDGSVESVRSAFPLVSVLETGENLGFTGGNNAGLAYLATQDIDLIYLLNNDTVSHPLALSALVTAWNEDDNREKALLAPVIHYHGMPQRCWFAGSSLDLRRGTALHDNGREPLPTDAPFDVPWASGCAMLMPIHLLKSLRGFDDRYFLNWEDVDLSMRVRRAGGSIRVVPKSRIYHKVGSSFKGISEHGRYYHVRNNLLFLREHAGKHYKRSALSVVSHNLRENAREMKRREPKALAGAKATLQAIQDHYQNRYGARMAVVEPNLSSGSNSVQGFQLL